ncbi:MAG: SEC-C domain-containing protein [Candidatus Eisenbacteria sp.]|nr:SEC-C domain-containing protein [Candidatus Eisenbacteria bacterium]
MQKKKPGPSKRMMRKIQSKTMGRFCHAANYKGGLDIGRNDPCPCGSGLKAKRCCLK